MCKAVKYLLLAGLLVSINGFLMAQGTFTFEGTICVLQTGMPLHDVEVEILEHRNQKYTSLSEEKTTDANGNFIVRVSIKEGGPFFAHLNFPGDQTTLVWLPFELDTKLAGRHIRDTIFVNLRYKFRNTYNGYGEPSFDPYLFYIAFARFYESDGSYSYYPDEYRLRHIVALSEFMKAYPEIRIVQESHTRDGKSNTYERNALKNLNEELLRLGVPEMNLVVPICPLSDDWPHASEYVTLYLKPYFGEERAFSLD